jgi:hypothetical protein
MKPAIVVVIGAVGGIGLGLVCMWIYDIQADDPAVVVCEALAKSELTEGTTYKRTAAVLDGSVKLNYELKYKKDREIPQSLECKFQRSPDQADFIFFQSKGCELPEKADRSDPGYNLCEQLLAAMARLRNIQQRAVAGLGIYPIPASSTRLLERKP